MERLTIYGLKKTPLGVRPIKYGTTDDISFKGCIIFSAETLVLNVKTTSFVKYVYGGLAQFEYF